MASPSEVRQSLRDGLPEATVRNQLQRVLASGAFSRSERLSTFLRFIVEETLAGRGDSLKEQVLAIALYGQRPNDDDSIVRADARRVRDKLREFYAEAVSEPVIISLPKGSYTPLFERNAPEIIGQQSLSAASQKDLRVWGVVAAAVVAIGILLAWWMLPRAAPRLQVVPLTAYAGAETDPSLSPDGNFVAFSWSGSGEPDPPDIWIKSVGSEALRRLTQTPVAEMTPSWSPDGKEIAFARQRQGVFIVSHLGGAERRISDSGWQPRWTPDGRFMLIRDRAKDRGPAAIFEINLETLTRRQLTHPPSGNGDGEFEVSPNGSTLAFTRSDRAGVMDIYLMPAGGGEPRRLTNWGAPMYGLAWTPDGRDIVYAIPGQSLWRISARTAPPGKGQRLMGFEAMVAPMALPFQPSISRPGPGRAARLAFETRTRNITLRWIHLTSGDPARAQRLLPGTRVDVPGAISSDGQQIGFRSYSADGWRLWQAKRDGTDLRQLTPVAAYMTEIGSWSPDGRFVVFDAAVEGNSDIYVVAEHGGVPKRLTTEPSVEIRARWSRDGRWIFYSSNCSGRFEIWKMPSAGGSPIQITRNGGFEPMESTDGRSIFYLDQPPKEGVISSGEAKLRMVPIEGGEEKDVLPIVRAGMWGVTNDGILFLSVQPDFDAIDLYQFASGQIKRAGRLPFRIDKRGFGRLVFSPDGRWVLTNQEDRLDSDLMVVENFR